MRKRNKNRHTERQVCENIGTKDKINNPDICIVDVDKTDGLDTSTVDIDIVDYLSTSIVDINKANDPYIGVTDIDKIDKSGIVVIVDKDKANKPGTTNATDKIDNKTNIINTSSNNCDW